MPPTGRARVAVTAPRSMQRDSPCRDDLTLGGERSANRPRRDSAPAAAAHGHAAAPVELEQVTRVRERRDVRHDAVRRRRDDVAVIGDPEVATVEPVLQPAGPATVTAARTLLPLHR